MAQDKLYKFNDDSSIKVLYDYINNDTLNEYKTEELERVYEFHQDMFKLTFNQYKNYLKFVEDHKDCRIDKITGFNKFGTIGGGTSITYKSNNKWDIFDKLIRCHGCNIKENLEDTDIKLDISEDKLQKDYEKFCKYGPSFNKVEFYRFNAIWEKYIVDKGEQIEVSFMGTGLGYIISVQTSDFKYEITDTSNW
jgi:hypothetical protein